MGHDNLVQGILVTSRDTIVHFQSLHLKALFSFKSSGTLLEGCPLGVDFKLMFQLNSVAPQIVGFRLAARARKLVDLAIEPTTTCAVTW